jgi:hypothetical protein
MPGLQFRRRVPLAFFALAALIAPEYHGEVTSGGLPLPGVTVTAVRGDKTIRPGLISQKAASQVRSPTGADLSILRAADNTTRTLRRDAGHAGIVREPAYSLGSPQIALGRYSNPGYNQTA